MDSCGTTSRIDLLSCHDTYLIAHDGSISLSLCLDLLTFDFETTLENDRPCLEGTSHLEDDG